MRPKPVNVRPTSRPRSSPVRSSASLQTEGLAYESAISACRTRLLI